MIRSPKRQQPSCGKPCKAHCQRLTKNLAHVAAEAAKETKCMRTRWQSKGAEQIITHHIMETSLQTAKHELKHTVKFWLQWKQLQMTVISREECIPGFNPWEKAKSRIKGGNNQHNKQPSKKSQLHEQAHSHTVWVRHRVTKMHSLRQNPQRNLP